MTKRINTQFNIAKTCLAFVFALLVVVPNNETIAQAFDPSLLQNLQRNGQGSNTTMQQSPLDRAREADAEEELSEAKEAAVEIAESISLLEEDFRGRTNDEESGLSQFGYDIFKSVSLGVNASVGTIPANYIMGVGDQLIVSFVGSTDRSITVNVDNEGRLILPDLSPINVAGRKFSEFEKDLKAKVSEAMLGTDVYVSIGSVRQVGVYILGEVSMPGLHNLTSLSTVLQALAKAGGVKKTGSLRAIQVEFNGQSKVFDLYALMSSSTEQNILLQDGSRIIVPTIGKTVGVNGRVARPAIYELAKDEDHIQWGELLNLAGDTTRPRGNDFSVNRFEEDGTQSLLSIDAASEQLLAGDLALVNYKRDVVIGEVFLTGHVQVEGNRPLASAPTLSALLKGTGAFGPKPYLAFGVIETVDPLSRARLYKHVNIENVVAGIEDVKLNNQDRVVIYSAADVSFLSSPVLRGVVLTGEYSSGECKALEGIAEFVNNYGRDRFAILSRNIFVDTSVTVEAIKENSTESFNLDNSRELDAQEELFSGQSGGVLSFDDVAEEGANGLEEEQDSCIKIFEDNVGLLAYTLEHVAAVNGAVRTPGLFPISGEVPLSSVMAFAGGFSRDADMSLIEMLMVNQDSGGARESTIRSVVNGLAQSLDGVFIKANYSVRANSRTTDQESGTVLLSGEFARPGVYAIVKGEKLSELIERAGGLTNYAYPLGAIFTRLSAKESQQEGFRRAAREINSALAVAAVRSDVDAEAIIAAQNLSDELTTVEALGRVVVEADVSILRVRPEFDTILEPGDKLIMPKRPNFVTIGGDVLNPGALQFISGKSVKTYLAEAGGMQRSADEDRVYLVHPNGVASPIKLSRWGSDDQPVLPGSAIIVPKNLDPLTTFERMSVFTQILSQLALSAASIAVIAN